jgi:hypothetical protein
MQSILLGTYVHHVFCLAYSSTLKTEICSSETLVDVQRTTWRYIPKHIILQAIKFSCTVTKSAVLHTVAGPYKAVRGRLNTFAASLHLQYGIDQGCPTRRP